MAVSTLNIENLPSAEDLEKLIQVRRQELAQLRKLKSLAHFREQCAESGFRPGLNQESNREYHYDQKK